MKMNLPNRLTMLRIVMIPFFVFFILVPQFNRAGEIIALLIFLAASFTDMLDGRIARRRHLITNFGKFMDPLADKMLVCSAMICLVKTEQLAAWIVIIIIGREFIISSFRLIASDNGIVIAASMWGKAKTVSQMAMIILLILNLSFLWYQVLCVIVTYLALVLTVISLIDYVKKNANVLKEQN